MKLLSIFLQEQGAGGGMMSILMIVLLFVIMYFFMIRPQQKKQKEIQKQRESLKVGDKIVTAGGILGKLKEIDETTFTIEIAEGVKVKVDRASVFAAGNDAQSRK
jgi:preprotein translocase subunit YajC